MPARPILSGKQWEVFFNYMEANPDFAKGKLGPKIMTERWKNLSRNLNAVGSGCKKKTGQWRDYWNNLKYKSLKQLKIVQTQLRTLAIKGYPEERLTALTEIQKRVLKVLWIPLPELRVKSTEIKTSPQLLECEQTLDASSALKPSWQESTTSLEVKIEPFQDRSPSVSSSSDSTGTISPVLKNGPSTKCGLHKPKGASENATSTTNIFADPLGEPSSRSKRDSFTEPDPQWVREIEERRIATEERSARALQGIQANTEFCASALQDLSRAQERMNNTLKGIQAALEATARALQREPK